MDASFTGRLIAERRKSLGLTQKELAEKLHVTDKAVSKWECGVNFPDLGLMEALANALETTPAALLGLEDADREQLVSSITELSEEQLEEARKDLRIFSWGSLVTALLLALTYHLVQKQAVEAYYLLSGLIFLLAFTGWIYLFKYGEIKKWEPKELGSFFGALLPLLIWLGYMFLTGDSLSQSIVWALIGISSVYAQLHFIQVMRPRFMQTLPLVLALLYVGYQLFLGGPALAEWIPAVCCLAVLAFDLVRHPEKRHVNWKALGISLCLILLAVFLVCIFCYPSLVRSYVSANHEKLEARSRDFLLTEEQGSYGLWDVTTYSELGLVAFETGGSGLAPGAVYEGFYYSASGSHIPFPGFEGEAEITGSTAWFYDAAENSDNWQKSTQITGNLYWYELHY